jgi:hypothetical protein
MAIPADSCDSRSEDSYAFKRAVEAIAIFTRAIHQTTDAEAFVTKEFAAPLSLGGLLVLLRYTLLKYIHLECIANLECAANTLTQNYSPLNRGALAPLTCLGSM